MSEEDLREMILSLTRSMEAMLAASRLTAKKFDQLEERVLKIEEHLKAQVIPVNEYLPRGL